MPQLSPEQQKRVSAIAERHSLNLEAAATLLEALQRTGGTMAQFQIPELGGTGQWMQGGMTMVGDFFNQGLKTKVDSLCRELAPLVQESPIQSETPMSQQSQNQGGSFQYQGNRPGGSGPASLQIPSAGSGNWWPADLGQPSFVGSQNHVRYAYFPGSKRLAVEVHGTLSLYDTLDHQIGGVSQQQGRSGSLTFTSQHGTVDLEKLPKIPSTAVPEKEDPGTSRSTPVTSAKSAPTSSQSSASSAEILTAIERLGQMNKKGILSDAEFQAKKAELLARL